MDDIPAFKIRVKVVPGSSKNYIAGWLGEYLKIRVCAAPEKGRANAAVESTIANALDIPRTDVHIIKGKLSVLKVVDIVGLSKKEIDKRLAQD
jgi:uncharacterized protein (TIGR00251 family)